MKKNEIKSPFVVVEDVAKFLGCSRELVYRLADKRKTEDVIPHYRIGKKLKFRLDSPAFEAWVERRLQGEPS